MFRFIAASFALVLFLIITACGGGGGGGKKNTNEGNSSSSSSNNNSSNTNSSNSNSSAAVACNNDQGSAISTRNNTSHRVGQNCLSCHTTGGSAMAMTVAGTVFKSGGIVGNPNATVRLYQHNSNTLVATLVTDKCGNFYTTATIPGLFVPGGPFVDGVDPVVEDSFGGLHTMPGKITGGGCNGCHGAGNGKIVVD